MALNLKILSSPPSPCFKSKFLPIPKSLTLTLKRSMASSQRHSDNPPPLKRPFCHRCSKPLRLCLCSRLKTPPLDNPIGITILQHSLEKRHPLNSTRVARIGFKNLAVVPVTDVNFTAEIIVCPIDQNRSLKRTHFDLGENLEASLSDLEESLDLEKTRLEKFDDLEPRGDNGVVDGDCGNGCFDDHQNVLRQPNSIKIQSESFDLSQDQLGLVYDNGVANGDCCGNKYQNQLEKPRSFGTKSESLELSPSHMSFLNGLNRRDDTRGYDGHWSNWHCFNYLKNHEISLKKSKSIRIQAEQAVVEATFDKYQVTCSPTDLRIKIERTAEPDISWVLSTPIGRAFASNGFTIKKIQRKQLPNSEELQEFEEFNIVMPPSAVLLFPSGKSTLGLHEVNFEVRHLVVLDGTWAKAQRMYHENPWLKLLPHIKLDPMKESLYGEVRHQPKAGCLSTIESIIYTLKGLGNDMKGLDELLDVFESMIGDQRLCKDEKFRDKAMS